MTGSLVFLVTVLLLLLAVALALATLLVANKRLTEAHELIATLQAEGANQAEGHDEAWAAAQESRLRRATQFISAYLDPYFGLPPHQIEDRLAVVIQEVRLTDEPATRADLAEGLALLVRVTPQIAMHTRNYTLLGHLWARVDPGSFVYICGRLALAVPGREDMVSRWRENQMTWNQLLDDLRILELRDALALRTQPEGIAPPPVPPGA
jgi:hypothetical protein